MKQLALAGAMSLLISACNQSETIAPAAEVTEIAPQKTVSTSRDKPSFSQLALGGKVFQQYCAECHGSRAEGEPNWQQPRPDGSNSAPPLNGTGHAWHHPKKILLRTIAHGSPGGGRMPAWKDKLTQNEMEAVAAWFINQWPDEVYQAWYRRYQGS